MNGESEITAATGDEVNAASGKSLDGFALFLLSLVALSSILLIFLFDLVPVEVGQFCSGDCQASADLRAQINMATAAWAMVFISVLGTVVGVVTLFLIFSTLQETQRAAKAAEDAVDATREIGMNQVRAYLSLESAELLSEPDGTSFEVFATIRNAGQSPARMVRCTGQFSAYILYFDADFEDHRENYLNVEAERSHHDIAAGMTTTVRFWFSLHEERTSLHKCLSENGPFNVGFDCRISSEDVFGRPAVELGRFHDTWAGERDFLQSIPLRKVENEF